MALQPLPTAKSPPAALGLPPAEPPSAVAAGGGQSAGPVIEVEAPDGKVIEFPQGTDWQVIDEVMSRIAAPLSRTTAAGRGAADFMTAGFYDELRGAAEAGGAGPDDPMSLGSVVKGAYRLATDEPEAEVRYATARDRKRAETEQAYKERPLATIGGGVAGTLLAAPLMPGAASHAARSITGRLAQGAATGAAAGAAYGAGSAEGDIIDRSAGAGTGALYGAPFGMAGEVVGAAARPGLEWLKRAFGAGAKGKAAAAPTRAGKPSPTLPTANRTPQGVLDAAKAFDIPLSRGQITRDADQLAFEEAARHYAKGRVAGDRMTGFDKAQRESVDRAAGGISKTFSAKGEEVAPSPLDAAGFISDRVRGAASKAKTQVGKAYDAARSKGGAIKREAVDNLGVSIRMRLEEAANPVIIDELTPRAAKALEEVDKLGTFRIRNDARVPRGVVPVGEKTQIAGVSMEGIEQVRKKLNALYRSAADPTDKRAVRKVIGQYDDWLDEVLDNSLFEGTDDALQGYKAARDMYRRYRATFRSTGPGDDVGRLIERMQKAEITPQEVANWVFGNAQVGETGLATRAASRLKQIFGKDSDEVAALRQGMWLRLTGMGGDARTVRGAERTVNSIMAFVAGRGKATASVVYSAKQRHEMRRFARVLRTTLTPEGLRNPSKSAFAIERAVRSAGESMGMNGSMIGQIATLLKERILQGKAGRRATASISNPTSSTRSRAFATAGGLAADPTVDAYQSRGQPQPSR